MAPERTLGIFHKICRAPPPAIDRRNFGTGALTARKNLFEIKDAELACTAPSFDSSDYKRTCTRDGLVAAPHNERSMHATTMTLARQSNASSKR
jgi:hypothetical protein